MNDRPSGTVTRADQPLRLIYTQDVIAKPGETYKRSSSQGWIFEYIVSGTGVLEVGSLRYTPGPGDLYMLPNGLGHRYSADQETPWRKIYFVIDGPLVAALLKAYRMETVYHVHDCGCRSWFKKILALRVNHAEGTDDRTALLFHQMLVHLAGRQDPSGDRHSPALRKTMAFLHASIERPVGMRDIAVAAGISSSHLSRTFRGETGLSPYDYLIKLRMEQACTLLALPRLKVADVAARLCYADAYYFSNAFKQRVGKSPRQYRRKFANTR